ncbi:MAG: YifB family Mg chelatase-like AAA ATPase [Gammaproteobacteria bacterium]|nr:YifB family Mg chelatase-like AAA ATPase [Gammaproteobacteria bacterium]
MSLATVYSRAQTGMEAPLVTVEVDLSNGLPGLSIVGLPEAAVKESKDRVRAALLNSGFDFPTRRITVNLAPADLPKEGGRFDLPIALGILAASKQLPQDSLKHYEFIGELSLSGELRAIHGVLPAAVASGKQQRATVVPIENGSEALLAKQTTIFASNSLLELCAHLSGQEILTAYENHITSTRSIEILDIHDVRGQHRARRALEVAAAGSHNMLMVGSPGSGKTMLASRLPSILPPLSETEAIESATIYSISHGGFTHEQWGIRPFRAPHHTASGVALVGGGSHPMPGEISLAHYGVLFLDELTEFDRHVLEVLREPLETGNIAISRAARQVQFPARFQLVAAMNPCPQGCDIDVNGNCACTPEQIRRYRGRISAPLLDRIDIHIDVPRVPKDQLIQKTPNNSETSHDVQTRVCASRDLQINRQQKPNAYMSNKEIEKFCPLNDDCDKLMDKAFEQLGLYARGYHQTLKLARTIADLDTSDTIKTNHLSEAISYRQYDRLLNK